ncbi:MAG: S8 family serine peptidase, partial [Candidatus Hadarchaeota archaeon]
DNVGYPARYDSVIAVAATDDKDNRARFSSTGPDVELAAPGVDILSTYLDGSYATASGTSMACPHVSGTAALVFAAGFTDDDGDGSVNDEIRFILQSTAEDLGADGRDERFGYGLVDAEAAASTIEDTTPPDKVTNLTATAVSSSQIDLSWDANSESDLDHYNIYRDDVKVAESNTNSYSDTGLSASTTYTYEVSAVDTSGNEGNKSDPASATTFEEDTTPPAKVTNLTATAVSSSQIDLAWDANTEDDLDHYNIYRDDNFIDSTTSTSYSDTGLSSNTTYTYEVSAVDTSGNEGERSDPASATTEEGATMHVEDVYLWLDRTRGPWEDIGVEVTVVDSDGNGVSDVAVDIQLDTPEGKTLTGTATTDSSGVASTIFDKASRTSGEYNGTVTDLTHSSYTWDTSADVETLDTLNTS